VSRATVLWHLKVILRLVFKQVGDSAYVWGGECESCPFRVVICVCGWCCAHYFVLYLPF
jgi:hypothetical protein